MVSPCSCRRPNRRMINAFIQHFLLLIRDWILRQLLCDALRKDVLFTIPPDLNATYLFIKPFGRMPLLHTMVDLVFWKHSKIHLNAGTIIKIFPSENSFLKCKRLISFWNFYLSFDQEYRKSLIFEIVDITFILSEQTLLIRLLSSFEICLLLSFVSLSLSICTKFNKISPVIWSKEIEIIF